MAVPSTDFILEKNKQTNEPMWLYRVSVDGIAANDLFLAEYDDDVEYFKDTNTAQTYSSAIPITHKGMDESADGKIGGITVDIANATREMQAFLELNDGLRGRKVTIRQVFQPLLADSDAYIEDVYWVDSAVAELSKISFKLTSRLDILRMTLPRRKFYRNYCPWSYKGEGCYLKQPDGSFLPPATFSGEGWMVILAGTRSISGTSGVLSVNTTLHPVDLIGLDVATDQVKIDMMISDSSRIDPGPGSQFELTSSGSFDDEELHYESIHALVSNAWQTFTWNLSDFGTTGVNPFNPRALDYIRAYIYITAGASVTLSWRNLRIYRADPYTLGAGVIDSCEKTITDCKRHNNIARFGGFPSVPARSVFRVGR